MFHLDSFAMWALNIPYGIYSLGSICIICLTRNTTKVARAQDSYRSEADGSCLV